MYNIDLISCFIPKGILKQTDISFLIFNVFHCFFQNMITILMGWTEHLFTAILLPIHNANLQITLTIFLFHFGQISLVDQALRELSNPGASGSVFYLTDDDEFIIKTVQHKEADFLQKLLPGYYMVSKGNGLHIRLGFWGLKGTISSRSEPARSNIYITRQFGWYLT